ncbi:DUF397 domain-containing protein [Streptomyces sp. NPDC014894]|uniref:DUF397 domain-containing protein n=1 Tax=Streptomyces sp. NPDC014894 TaxID=3364931 RepID=UPI0036FBEEC4
MSTLRWFKSSFSEASGNACIEVAVDPGEGIAIRDSRCPARMIVTDRSVFAVFVTFAGSEPGAGGRGAGGRGTGRRAAQGTGRGTGAGRGTGRAADG